MNLVDLGVAHEGLLPSDVERLEATVMRAAEVGRTTNRWQLTAPADAHLIIRAAASHGDDGSLPALGAPKQLTAILAGEADRVEASRLTLRWPISLENVIELLRKAEDTLVGGPARRSAPADLPLIRLATLIRESTATSMHGAWSVKGLGAGTLYIVPSSRQFYYSESLLGLSRSAMTADLDIAPAPLDAIAAKARTPLPLVRLQWSLGLLTGSLGMLPWISPGARFRLSKFPAFPILQHKPVHRRVAAALARSASAPLEVTELLQLEERDVVSFVNAAELCGYLQLNEVTPRQSLAVKVRSTSRRFLADVFRKALGIGSADA